METSFRHIKDYPRVKYLKMPENDNVSYIQRRIYEGP